MHYHYFTLEQRDALSREILDLTVLDSACKASALDWLHSPEYGICQVCGSDIPFAELLGNPLQKTCSHCRP